MVWHGGLDLRISAVISLPISNFAVRGFMISNMWNCLYGVQSFIHITTSTAWMSSHIPLSHANVRTVPCQTPMIVYNLCRRRGLSWFVSLTYSWHHIICPWQVKLPWKNWIKLISPKSKHNEARTASLRSETPCCYFNLIIYYVTYVAVVIIELLK